ncbi:MAG: collagen-like protein, partial [Alphaproteobacteria bacterium]|nr:collagen-like protein [Alphaproteobacteria bacterium]
MKIKNLFLTIVATVATLAAVAQTDGFSYQAVVRNAAGELVDNSKVGLRLTLTAGQNGDAVYQETHTPTTNSYGVLSITVGSGTPAKGQSLSNVDWASGDVWMRVEIDPNGGTKYTDMGSTKLQSVPYAYFAANGGQQGPKGDTGDKGDKGEAFKYSDFTQEQLDALKGPQGPIGPVGPQGPAGTGLNNKGEWEANTTYSIGDYVFSRSTADENTNSMWIAKSENFVSNTLPYQDNINWVEFQAPKGETGERGLQGPAGPQGLQGPDGPQGPQGPQGNQGPQGLQGIQGPAGPQGPKGDPGVGLTNKGAWVSGTTYKSGDYVFAPSTGNNNANSMWIAQTQSAEGFISSTQPKNDAANWVEFTAPQGEKGEQGDKGETGAQGPQGIQGIQGPQGKQGPIGPQGPAGRDGMQVSGSKGQTLVHNGTTWVATDEISLKKLDVKAETVSEDALFEVKDKDGNVVFAVYPNGVHVYIDPEA